MLEHQLIPPIHQYTPAPTLSVIKCSAALSGKPQIAVHDQFAMLQGILKLDVFLVILAVALSLIPAPFNVWALGSLLACFCAYGFLRISLSRGNYTLKKRANHRIFQAIFVLIGTITLFWSAFSEHASNSNGKLVLLGLVGLVPLFTILCMLQTLVLQVKTKKQRAVIIGSSNLTQVLVNRFAVNISTHAELQCAYSIEDVLDPCVELFKGNLSQFFEDAKHGLFDEVYIGLPATESMKAQRIIDELSDSTCNVFFISEACTREIAQTNNMLADQTIISVYGDPLNVVDRAVKRIFDILFSAAFLVVFAIPMLLIALTIKLTSRGPAIFKQRRYGRHGDVIEVWKFRSMTTMDNGAVVVQACKNDLRITKVGAFLRKTSLDELPQFINVLLGHMSVVGPRPHAIAHNEEYRRLIKGYMLRHKVKPGITGWAQINGWRGETDTLDKMEQRIQYDLEYIYGWSIWWDLKIAILTPIKGFINKNAY